MVPAVPAAAAPLLVEDGELIARHFAGDEDAFALIYERYQPRLVSRLRWWGNDAQSAEDLAHETLLRAFRNLHQFEVSRPLWPWLAVIARRVSIDATGGPVQAVDPGDSRLVGVEDDDTSGYATRLLLLELLDQLPPRQRVALTIRYLWDYERGEAAALLGISKNAFDQLVHRGREGLLAAFEDAERRAGERLRILWPVHVVWWMRDKGRSGCAALQRVFGSGGVAEYAAIGLAATAIAAAGSVSPAAGGALSPPPRHLREIAVALRPTDQSKPLQPQSTPQGKSPLLSDDAGDEEEDEPKHHRGAHAGHPIAPQKAPAPKSREGDAGDVSVRVQGPGDRDVHSDGDSSTNCETTTGQIACAVMPEEPGEIVVPFPGSDPVAEVEQPGSSQRTTAHSPSPSSP